jgi:PPOX class probable F420-dependent enzyme
MPMFTMTHELAMESLAVGARTGKVATASRDGKVHVAPLWFVVDGQDLVFVTTATSVKGRHLHANPRAALCVDDDTYPCAFVTARGPVVLEDQATDLRD